MKNFRNRWKLFVWLQHRCSVKVKEKLPLYLNKYHAMKKIHCIIKHHAVKMY
jgi:hypothetical protein